MIDLESLLEIDGLDYKIDYLYENQRKEAHAGLQFHKNKEPERIYGRGNLGSDDPSAWSTVNGLSRSPTQMPVAPDHEVIQDWIYVSDVGPDTGGWIYRASFHESGSRDTDNMFMQVRRRIWCRVTVHKVFEILFMIELLNKYNFYK